MNIINQPNLKNNYNTREPFVSVTRQHPCPVCGKPDNCSVTTGGRIAYCRRVRGERQGRDGGWTHFLTHDPPLPKVTPPKPTPQKTAERASADHFDGVLTTLLRKHLTLSDEHRSKLLSRGLTTEEIERNGYRSTPTAAEGDLIARELSVCGLEGVPGFYRERGEGRMRDFGAGFYVPVRDERSRIVGCQIRRDEGTPKYLWFSSSGKAHGTSSSSPIHFAKPHLLHDSTEVLLTEGALKADVSSFFLNTPVIAAAGVNNFGPDFAANLKEKFPKLKTPIICFDSDFRTKPQVKAALEKLISELSGAGFRVRVRTWQPEHKGLDDFLLALAPSQVKEVAA